MPVRSGSICSPCQTCDVTLCCDSSPAVSRSSRPRKLTSAGCAAALMSSLSHRARRMRLQPIL
jgi:hypothetical protein